MSRNQKHSKKKQKKTIGVNSIQNEFVKAYDLHNQNQTDRAETMYRNIIRKDPGHPDALHLLGVIALERNDYDTALTLIKRAIKNYPKAAPYYNNLGLVFRKKGMMDEAAAAYRKALEIDPDYAEALNNLGTLLKDRVDLTGAIECFEKATRVNTGFATAYYNLGTVLSDQARIPAAVVSYKKALEINPDFTQAYSNLLYTLHFSDTWTPDAIFQEHLKWGRHIDGLISRDHRPFDYDADPKRKLKIGYVSPDFCTHSVAFFIEEVMACHKRQNLEIFCYSNTPVADDFTARFRELSDHWRDVNALSDMDAADLIRADRIDILVDLAGHTRNNRILIFARKPAPVQVTWLGYPDTTGLSAMDYRLTDSIADPVGVADARHSETVYRMPHGFLCYRPAGEFFPVSPLPMLTTGAVTFGSFNNNSKISPRVIEAWAAILKEVPGSRLKLKAFSLGDFGTRKYILEEFQNQGVPSERIWFEGYRVSLKEHFLLYGSIDIALDTFPYNGTTTTCESLWMGVPVMVLSGDSHVSRVGNSILTHMDLTDLIAGSIDDYVAKAVALAKDPVRLASLRSELRGRMIDSPLMDATGFTADLESAYRMMWRVWGEKQMETHTKEAGKGAVAGMDYYEKNLQSLKTFHPHVLPHLDEREPVNMEVRIASSGLPNLYVAEKDGTARSVYPENDPLGDLPALEKIIQHVKGKTLCVMGAGLFIHAGPIVDRVGGTNLVVFFEAFPAVLRAAMRVHDLTGIFSHPNVRLAIGDSADPYVILSEERDQVFTNDLGEFIEYNRVVSLAPEWYKEKRNLFERFLKRRKISLVTEAFSGKSFLENSFRNLLALTESRHLDDLHDAFKGLPAILVASGPSLSKNIHHLKAINDKALIIAADSALAPLMAHGIKPHMVVSVDNNDFTFEKLAPFIDTLGDVDLVYIPNVTSKIVNGIRFKSKYYTFPDTSGQNLFNRILGRDGRALEDIHSVIHLALATAQVAGCNPIIFTGLDLAFSGTQDHVDGTILHWGNSQGKDPIPTMVEGIYGDMIPSSNGFIGMIEICQRMIQTVPGRIYIDATEGGAKIVGTTIAPLASTVETYCTHRMQQRELQGPYSGDTDLKSLLHELKRLDHELGQSLNHIQRYITEKAHVDQYMEKQPEGTGTGSLADHILLSVRAMDRINTELETEPVVSFVKGIMVEAYEKYKELEMDVMESESSSGHRFSKALKQQAFVQSVRKDALEYLSGEVTRATSWIEMNIDLDQRMSLSEQTVSDRIERLINRGYLVKAETVLEKMDQHPEKDYLLGCIALKKTQLKKGEDFFRKALDQDANLLSKVAPFKESIVNEWLDQYHLPALRKITIDRVLGLVPDHAGAIQLKQEWLLQRARQLISNGQSDQALAELMAERTKYDFDDRRLLDVVSFLVLNHGDVEQIIGHLKRVLGQETPKSIEIVAVRNNFKNMLDTDGLSMKPSWMTHLAKHANNELWARRALQELFWVIIGDRPGKIMRKQISVIELDEVGHLLNAWKDVKDLIPEWAYLESYRLLGLGQFDEAELMLKQSIAIENDTLPMKGIPGMLDYLLCMFALYMGDETKAVSLIRDVIVRHPDDLFRLTAALLLIRNNEDDPARMLLNDIFRENKDVFWVRAVGEEYQNGTLVQGFKQSRSLSFLSAYYLLMGRCFITRGQTDMGLLFLRASISHDSKVLGVETGAWVHGLIENTWEDDAKTIEDAIAKGLFDEASKQLGEWYDTRSALGRYHTVMADLIAARDNGENAIAYLNACAKESSDNPHVLFYLSKRLFEVGKRQEAHSFLDQAVSLNPQAAMLWETIGDVWYNETDYPMALLSYEKCLTALPDNVAALQKIGDVYQQMGQLDAAEIAYSAVLLKKQQPGSGSS